MLKNKFKKERSPLVDIEEIKKSSQQIRESKEPDDFSEHPTDKCHH